MHFSNNTNKMADNFDRSSFFSKRDSIRSSLMSRGLSILFTASIFTEEEEEELMMSQPFESERMTEAPTLPPTLSLQESSGSLLEPIPLQPSIPQPGQAHSRVVSAPPRLASSWHQQQTTELDNSSCGTANTRCDSNSCSSHVSEPGKWDIICGRNSGGFHYVGNRRFRVTVQLHMPQYLEAPTREDKTRVIKSIVRTLQDEVGARFLRKINKSEYKVMEDKEVRNKVAHTMRDMVQDYKKKDDQCSTSLPFHSTGRTPQFKQRLQRAATVGV
jgi:hypothetical protein